MFGIVTINDLGNYGNRLQNYAVQQLLSQYGDVETLQTYAISKKNLLKYKIWLFTKGKIEKILPNYDYRVCLFMEFNKKYINYSQLSVLSNDTKKIDDKYDMIAYGSDQIWNPMFGHFYAINPKTKNNFALSASIGIDKIPKEYKHYFKSGMKKFLYVSVRESRASELLKEFTNTEVQVLIDPTLGVRKSEWEKIMCKSCYINENDRYILLYFLGELSEDRKTQIKELAKKNNCSVINLKEKQYWDKTGPDQFLYLIKNAQMVITDSFHACIFSFIFDTSFYVLKRDDSMVPMNARMDTLLSTFELEDSRKENITEFRIEHDFKKGYKILEEEQKKLNKYLDMVLNNNENYVRIGF